MHTYTQTHYSSLSSGHSSSSSSSTSLSSNPFSSIGISSRHLLGRLQAIGIQHPTDIQRIALPIVKNGASVLIGAETGCGKSLAYLLPVLDKLIETTTEESIDENPPSTSADRSSPHRRRYPRVIIFQPNRELASQLESVLESLIGPSGSAVATNDGRIIHLHWAPLMGTQVFPIQGKPNIDILITTPIALANNIPYHDLARARSRRNKDEAAARLAGLPYVHSSSSSSSSIGHGRFDMVEFVRATETVVMDEVDFLLEGDMSPHTKRWIEDVWMAKRMRPRKNRKKIETDSTITQDSEESKEHDGTAPTDLSASSTNEAQLEAASDSQSLPFSSHSVAAPAVVNPISSDRQFIFVGATLTNISPLTCYQYLLDTFTPFEDRPHRHRGPRSWNVEDVPNSCTLKLALTSRLHHTAPEMQANVAWVKVGPNERPVEAIDEAALEKLIRRGATEDEDKDKDEDEIERDQDDTDANDSLQPQRVRNDRFFKPKNRARYDASEWRSEEAPEILPLTHDIDREKIRCATQFLNAHTPTQVQGPPRKSIMFVSSTKRLRSLVHELTTTTGKKTKHGLSPHIQLLPYHAELKPNERTATMSTFNSADPVNSTIDSHSAPITHQVLVCTSLVARGLDFNRIQPPPMPRTYTSITKGVRPGFTSLVQFDFAQNAVEYIHRVGRMWRFRREEKEEHKQQAARDETQDDQQPTVLNLYTAVDDLLVSRIRGTSDTHRVDLHTEADVEEAVASPSSPARSLDSGFVANDAFSRNRRLRLSAKRRIKRAEKEGTSDDGQTDGVTHQDDGQSETPQPAPAPTRVRSVRQPRQPAEYPSRW